MQCRTPLASRAGANPRATSRERPRRALTTILLAVVASALACSEASGPRTLAETGGQQAKGVVPVTGDFVVRGVVLGVDSVPGQPGRTQPLAGVAVTVIHSSRAPGIDSSATAPTLTTVGTVTSGADGTFELAGVASGWFYLDPVPPPGSGYRGWRTGTFSFAQGSTERANVYLHR